MNQNLDDLVRQSIAVTFETMAFMEVLPRSEDTAQEAADSCMSARLLVLDPLQAEMILTLPFQLLRNIIDVVHAFPEEDVVEQIQTDMLGELLNTIAGRLLNDFIPGDQSYRLGLPEVSKEQPVFCDGPSKTWEYDIEGEPLTFAIVGSGFFPNDQATA